MKSFILSLGLFMALPEAFANNTAQLTLPEWPSPYKPYWEVKAEVKKEWQLQQDSTFPIKFDLGLNCTGVFVGPNGEALTNLHCLEACIEESPFVSASDRKRMVAKNLNGVFCKARFGKPFRSVDVEVVKVFGPGWLGDRESLEEFFLEDPSRYLGLVKQGFESFGDLVLVRLPVKGACVRLAESSSREREKVLNISYPIVFRETENPREPLTSLGLSQMWSVGELSSSVQAMAELAMPHVVHEDQLSTIALEGMTLSSLDAESGASGSPMFNEQGEVLSLLRSTYKGLGLGYVPWTTQGIYLPNVREKIEALIPEVSSCGH